MQSLLVGVGRGNIAFVSWLPLDTPYTYSHIRVQLLCFSLGLVNMLTCLSAQLSVQNQDLIEKNLACSRTPAMSPIRVPIFIRHSSAGI